MYAFARLLGVVLVASALAGCLVETKNTIVENPLTFDERVVGTWARTGDGAAWLLMVRPDETDPTLGKVAYVYVNPGKDDIETGRTLFDVRLTEIGDAIYFEAEPKGPDPFPDSSEPVERFIGRIVLTDADTLRVEIPDGEVVAAAVEKGQLDGIAYDGNLSRSATLTGSTAQMRQFLSAPLPANQEGTSIYRRIE